MTIWCCALNGIVFLSHQNSDDFQLLRIWNHHVCSRLTQTSISLWFHKPELWYKHKSWMSHPSLNQSISLNKHTHFDPARYVRIHLAHISINYNFWFSLKSIEWQAMYPFIFAHLISFSGALDRATVPELIPNYLHCSCTCVLGTSGRAICFRFLPPLRQILMG